jgi:hypothetical protein
LHDDVQFADRTPAFHHFAGYLLRLLEAAFASADRGFIPVLTLPTIPDPSSALLSGFCRHASIDMEPACARSRTTP